VLATSVIAATLLLFIDTGLRRDSATLVLQLRGNAAPVITPALLVILIFPLFAIIWWGIGFRPHCLLERSLNAWRYPSSMVTVFFALAIYGAVRNERVRHDGWEQYFWIFLFPIPAIILGAIADWIRTAIRRRQKKVPLQPTSLANLSDAAFRAWAEREEPIADASQDFFGNARVARRIADQLRAEREVTIGLIGSFGTGKSSLIRLLRNELASERFIFVETSCWGFDDSAKAQEHILSAAIRELNKHIDCSTLRSLPANYVRTIASDSTWVSYVLNLINANHDPQVELQRLAPILSAIGSRLVIVIEDIDRTGAHFDRDHIAAMYYRLRNVPRVSFVLSGNTFVPFMSRSPA
jgi:hypothetical protein